MSAKNILPSKAKISWCQCCCFAHFLPELYWISFNIFVPVLILVKLSLKSKNVLNKMVNVCGKVVVERQHLSQLYECRVVRKARVIVDNNSHVIAKYYELFPSGRRFRVLKSNTVNSISEQMKPFGCQSSVCVCVCVCVCGCVWCVMCVHLRLVGIVSCADCLRMW